MAGVSAAVEWQTRKVSEITNRLDGERMTADGTAAQVMDSAEFVRLSNAITSSIATVIDGKPEAIGLALTVLFAEGHLLIEDVPGVGKTMLARALARTVDCSVSRIQFTPDLLPADITGVSVYDQGERAFEFKPGPVFANIVIGDEINRASPKTQSALLECMEEHQVTVDGNTYQLGSPFTVVATQNPIEMEGTYPLPESQRDRFMARISMGYPDADAELSMIRMRDLSSPLDSLTPVVHSTELANMIATTRSVFASAVVERYVVAIARATRSHHDVRLGASPRAALQLVRAAKARAAVHGRDFVLPDDVAALVVPVFAHRMVAAGRPSSGFAGTGVDPVVDILERILDETAIPLPPSSNF